MQNMMFQFPKSRKYPSGGEMNGVAYDTAWAARVTDQSGKPLFPECIQWLLEHQRPDGSWGSQIMNYHDRVISTLSCIIALKDVDGRRYKDYIQRGEAYIWRNMRNVETEAGKKLVGSELLLPSLMQQAQHMGLDLPYQMKVYEREYHVKLKRIEKSLWYSPLISLSFSLEFLGDDVDLDCLPTVQLPNGSVANSPATTAFFLKHTRNERAFRYLKKNLSLTGDGSLMTAYPFEVFECGWVMYNLMLAGLYFEWYTDICDFLMKRVGHSGVGMSTEFPVPDADDTVILLKALYNMGYPIDFSVFDVYDAGDYYLTYTFELDPSATTNIHILDFVESCPHFPDREEVMEKLVRFLRREMRPGGFWIDKWNVSRYYCTSHSIPALSFIDPSLAEKIISWILDTQNENGLWGENGGTLEETAYVVQALAYYHRHVERIDMEGISRAISALNRKDSTLLLIDLPGMWTAKVLYTPVRIVLSSIASAQFMTGIRNRQNHESIPTMY